MHSHAPAPEGPVPLDDPPLYINRELSWLEFNRRVLEEAQDRGVPLLERLKFLAIFGGNLDEFFMVRVGGLQQKVEAGVSRSSGADRMTPHATLDAIAERVRDMVAEQSRVLTDEVLPALEAEGIVLRGLRDLTEADHRRLREMFRREIFPVLTPLAVDPGHPFPLLSNKSLNLAVVLQRPRDGEELFAVVQVPAVLNRLVALPCERGHVFTPLETAVRLHLLDLFPGMELQHVSAFRVTRDSEYELEDDEVHDLLKAIEEGVRQRRRGDAVRLELEADAPAHVERFLTDALDLDGQDVYRVSGLLDVTGLFPLCSLPGFAHLREPEFTPQPVPEFLHARDIWSAIRQRDILTHHPYEAFGHVVDLVEAAAGDDRVLAIKQTLYRTSSDSPVVRALARAADRGKQVTAVVELKARLDEERNIVWARELEKAGVHVVFGFVGLKTHCKALLVVRREDSGIMRYVHLGTGNYNPQTARVYTDLGFFTANPEFAEDVSALFNYLTGYGELPNWRKLVVAPSRLKAFMLERIRGEVTHQLAGREGRVVAKVNGLLEPSVVQALYRASQAGVRVDIVCRGVCALRPGVPGVSDNIRVVSVVDRFLEHSRVFLFGNGGDPLVYLGSADWMDRNLSRRVEVVWPVEEPALRQRVIREVLAWSLADNVKARLLRPDGTYTRAVPAEGAAAVRSQERFLAEAAANAARAPAPDGPAPSVPYIEPRPMRKARRRHRQTG